MKNLELTTLILSGGEGRRMENQDKGWVEYLGKPLIHHAIEFAERHTDKIVLSYNRNRDRYAALQYPGSEDREPRYAGPLMGILSCKALISTDYTLIIPCDMPQLDTGIVSKLWQGLAENDLAVAHDGIRLQSLVFIARTQAFDSIEDYLKGTNRSVRGWLDSQDSVVVDFSAYKSAFQNINEKSGLQNP
ncbi:MAG: molybdenum cofactor guanylyltransferase MobA [Pseudomonadales bacterium]|jgi:molybdopterin-guanine dinucleotide biosynthesis protein A